MPQIYERSKNRIDWIDAIKAFAMLGVMLGHFEFFPEKIEYFLSPFLLSAFLFASGCTFHLEDSPRSFVIKRLKTLLWPWLWMGSIVVLSRGIISFKEHSSTFGEYINFLLQMRGNGDEGWFLVAIFCAEILFGCIVYFFKSSYKIVAISFGLCLVDIVANYAWGGVLVLPWHIQMWGTECFYLSLGYLFIHEFSEKAIFKNKQILVASIAVYCFLFWLNIYVLGYEAINFYSYGNNIIMYFALSLSALYVIVISCINLKHKPTWLLFVGENTLVYYGFHGKIESLFEKIIASYITGSVLNNLLLSIIGISVVYLIIAVVSILIKRFVPWLLGRSRSR